MFGTFARPRYTKNGNVFFFFVLITTLPKGFMFTSHQKID